jgi:hypothetical protein
VQVAPEDVDSQQQQQQQQQRFVRLAIEVDGPQHFRWPDRQPTGSTLYRSRVLTKRDYVVVTVSYYEWREWCETGVQKELLLQRIEQQVLKQQQSKHAVSANV